jgi:transcriptional regulator GlxA family with amidase domain
MNSINTASRRTVIKSAAAAGATLAAGYGFAQGAASAKSYKVAFLIDDTANMIDMAGPWEVFQDADHGGGAAFELFAVAEERRVYHTTGGPPGLAIMPHYTFADAPQPDVITIGAQRRGNNPDAKLDWIRKAAENAQIVMSVCTGAFHLARSGLLDGKRATTHHLYVDEFRRSFPNVETVDTRRFVDNGKFVTAGGLTSGIDAALHVVSRLKGEQSARATAEYMEYESKGWVTGA